MDAFGTRLHGGQSSSFDDSPLSRHCCWCECSPLLSFRVAHSHPIRPRGLARSSFDIRNFACVSPQLVCLIMFRPPSCPLVRCILFPPSSVSAGVGCFFPVATLEILYCYVFGWQAGATLGLVAITVGRCVCLGGWVGGCMGGWVGGWVGDFAFGSAIICACILYLQLQVFHDLPLSVSSLSSSPTVRLHSSPVGSAVWRASNQSSPHLVTTRSCLSA